jgi:cytochrome c oxidase subunit 2
VFWFITAVTVFFTLLIAVLVMFFAIRYRRRSEDYFPKPIVGSLPLELFWTIVPLVIALGMFFWGAGVYFDLMRQPDNALEIYVTGKQWMWHLQHASGEGEINKLHIPLGRPVKLIMTSEDVIHDFAIPAFRVKMDVLPGKYTYLWFQATRPGTYRFYCALYCGTDHSQMTGQVVVMEPSEYERWLTGSADRSLAMQGRQLFQKLNCVACHQPRAGGRAPVLEGLYGTRVPLDGGRTVLADESYLRESIRFPANKVRDGWRPIMPAFTKEMVSEQDMVKLIAFLKTLEPGGTPPRVEESIPPEASKE